MRDRPFSAELAGRFLRLLTAAVQHEPAARGLGAAVQEISVHVARVAIVADHAARGVAGPGAVDPRPQEPGAAPEGEGEEAACAVRVSIAATSETGGQQAERVSVELAVLPQRRGPSANSKSVAMLSALHDLVDAWLDACLERSAVLSESAGVAAVLTAATKWLQLLQLRAAELLPAAARRLAGPAPSRLQSLRRDRASRGGAGLCTTYHADHPRIVEGRLTRGVCLCRAPQVPPQREGAPAPGPGLSPGL
jgi:hypothetical protein